MVQRRIELGYKIDELGGFLIVRDVRIGKHVAGDFFALCPLHSMTI